MIQLNSGAKLSPHFTLGEMTVTNQKGVYNVPTHEAIANLKRLCQWLEVLRERYNAQILPLSRGRQRGSERGTGQLAQTTPNPSYSGGEIDTNCPPPTGDPTNCPPPTGVPTNCPPPTGGDRGGLEPIRINSAYRSPQLNKKIGGAATSNHLSGCAADIRTYGMEQALRYAVILLDYADESKQEFDELLIEKNRYGAIWLHFAVRPKDNRRKVMFINA